MAKVNFFDKRIFKEFLEYTSGIGAVLSFVLIFIEIPDEMKLKTGAGFVLLLSIIYTVLWFKSNNLEEVDLDIEGSTVTVKSGDIFEQPGFKVIAFNEYFDTLVDDKIISEQSLNGIFVNKYFPTSTEDLDEHIEKYQFDDNEVIEKNTARKFGKKIKYNIGTVFTTNIFWRHFQNLTSKIKLH